MNPKAIFEKLLVWFNRLISALIRVLKWIVGPTPLVRLFKVLAGIVGIVFFGLWFVAAKPDRVKELMVFLGDKAEKLARFLPAALPEQMEIKSAIWLEQNWSNRDRFWFHHTSQGTATFPIPYDWFMSLEQPELFFFRSPKRLSNPEYLRRFGFIPSPTGDLLKGKSDMKPLMKYGYTAEKSNAIFMKIDREKREREAGFPGNEDNLPVGFARLKNEDIPGGNKQPDKDKSLNAGQESYDAMHKKLDRVGFTCAACHTGHLEYNNVSLRFDGGPAMIDLGKLEAAIGLSIGYTLKIPFRFCRFADTVFKRLDKDNSAQEECDSPRKKQLEAELEKTLVILKIRLDWRTAILDSRKNGDVVEGFGRLDALNRIGNQVFYANFLPKRLQACAIVLQSEGNIEKAKKMCAPYLSKAQIEAGDLPMPSKKLSGNFRRVDAPVSFPPLWGVPWFSWAQYDASILNELVRNAGEALGVKAILHVVPQVDPKKTILKSSMKVQNLYWMEQTLRGDHPLGGKPGFKGLTAPKWPVDHFPGDANWELDADLVSAGRKLYRTYCFECHRGPVRDPVFDKNNHEDSFWNETNSRNHENWRLIGDKKYFSVVQKSVTAIGTDPQQALVLGSRKIYLPPELGLEPVRDLNRSHRNNNCGLPQDNTKNSTFALALMTIVDRVIDQWFEDHPEYKASEKVIRGTRPNCPNAFVFRPVVQKELPASEEAPSWNAKSGQNYAAYTQSSSGGKEKIVVQPAYRARPLDGIWATAPYLHNGSIPNIDELLKPASERIKVFCVGSRQFDPVRLGLKLEFPERQKRRDEVKKCPRGLTRLDTTALGSSNAGHSFEGNKQSDKRKYAAGVIGPLFDKKERKALIEYLKTL